MALHRSLHMRLPDLEQRMDVQHCHLANWVVLRPLIYHLHAGRSGSTQRQRWGLEVMFSNRNGKIETRRRQRCGLQPTHPPARGRRRGKSGAPQRGTPQP